MITVDKLDLSGLDEKLRKIAKLTKEVPADLMRQEGRLLAVELSRYTQPFGTGEEAQRLGEGAVKGDLLGGGRGGWAGVKRAGLFYVIPDGLASQFKWEHIEGRIRLFARRDGKVYGTDVNHLKYNASIQELEEFHHRSKNADGSYGSEAGTMTQDNGRWKFITKWVIKQSQFDELLKVLTAKVGFAKSGWATCAEQLGGTRGIQKWVTKHKAPGTVVDETTAEQPKLTIRNDTNYTSQVLSESGAKEALRDREIKLTERIKNILKSRFHLLYPE